MNVTSKIINSLNVKYIKGGSEIMNLSMEMASKFSRYKGYEVYVIRTIISKRVILVTLI